MLVSDDMVSMAAQEYLEEYERQLAQGVPNSESKSRAWDATEQRFLWLKTINSLSVAGNSEHSALAAKFWGQTGSKMRALQRKYRAGKPRTPTVSSTDNDKSSSSFIDRLRRWYDTNDELHMTANEVVHFLGHSRSILSVSHGALVKEGYVFAARTGSHGQPYRLLARPEKQTREELQDTILNRLIALDDERLAKLAELLS